jgi:hypothetical protein
MTDEVTATPTGASESEAPSTTDRLKAFFSQSDAIDKPEPKAKESVDPVDSKAEPQGEAEPDEGDEVEAPQDDGQTEQVTKPTSLKELAETLGADIEDILGIDIPTKIDGKEGTARLRDLLKSYQLEGHLNQKSMAFADEKKAFEAEAQRKVGEWQQKSQQLDAAVQIAQRLLDGEFANVNWEELQGRDRLEFNQKAVEYQQRQQALTHLAGILGQERQQQQADQTKQFAAYKAEQMKLLESKLPEWADKDKRAKDITMMSKVLNEAYGVTEQELKSETNHRLILIARDAAKYQELQKQKPAILNKVKTAPKVLKPGVMQSQATQDNLAHSKARDRLRSTGKVSDAATRLKQLGVV